MTDVYISTTDLRDALTRLSVLTRRVSALKISRSVLISVHGGDMMITATDLETTATIELPCASIGEPWSGTVDAKRLIDAIKGKTGDVQISCGDMGTIRIGATVTLPYGDPGEFPDAPAPAPILLHTSIHAGVLCSMIDRLAPIAYEWYDKMDHVLGMGICMDGGNIRLISTDSKRIATAWQGRPGYDVQAILPKAGLLAASKILAKLKDTVHLELTDSACTLNTPSTHIHIQRLTGWYPECSEILEIESSYKLVLVARKPLLSALKSAAALWPTKAKDTLPIIELTVSRDSITVRSENIDTGSFTDTIVLEGATDRACDGAYNARHLVDAVSAITSNIVRMYVGGGDDPTYIVDDGFKVAVMPLRRV